MTREQRKVEQHKQLTIAHVCNALVALRHLCDQDEISYYQAEKASYQKYCEDVQAARKINPRKRKALRIA